MKNSRLLSLTLLLVAVLAKISCDAQEGETNPATPAPAPVVKKTAKLASVDWTEENFGKAMGAIMKLSMLLLLFMLFLDMYTRMLKQPGFKIAYTFRFIWFVWVGSFTYFIGSDLPLDNYREFLGNVYREYFL